MALDTFNFEKVDDDSDNLSFKNHTNLPKSITIQEGARIMSFAKKNVMAHCASPVKCNVWVGSCRNLMERKKRKRKNVGTAVLFIRFRFNKIDYFPWSSVIF